MQARAAVIVQNHGEPPIRVGACAKKHVQVLITLILRMALPSSLRTAIVFIFPLLDNYCSLVMVLLKLIARAAARFEYEDLYEGIVYPSRRCRNASNFRDSASSDLGDLP